MIDGRWLRAGIVLAVVALVALVYFLPKGAGTKSSAEAELKDSTSASTFSEAEFKSRSKSKLDWNLTSKLDSLEKLLVNSPKDTVLLDSIAAVWDGVGVPGMSASLFEQKAKHTGFERTWLNAAYRYFDAYKAAQDSVEAAWFVSKAMNSYGTVLELNPTNLDAKTDLGILYAEASPEPMKGITLLREVVTANPKHENAQMNLGFLSMKSGQFDKAIERFRNVLEINPSRIDSYVYIGEAYLGKTNKDSAIVNFTIFKNLTNDQEMIKQIDQYIAEINKQ